jgi:hypothetical protein
LPSNHGYTAPPAELASAPSAYDAIDSPLV